MKRKFWSVGSIVALAILAGSLFSLYYIVTQVDFGVTPPPFSELKTVSGHVEYVQWREWGEMDSAMEIKIQGEPTPFQYFVPHKREVSRALQEGVTVQFWVDSHDFPEVWQAAVDGIIISPYQSRVAWGKSNARLGKIFVSSLLFLLALIPSLYLVSKMRGR